MALEAVKNEIVHGHAKGQRSPTYNSWRAMIHRCRTSTDRKHAKYRNVEVCERWLVFANFLADMGERPEGKTLDRIDNARGYEPGNCRWATKREQSMNTTRNVRIEIGGVVKTATEWAQEVGIDPSLVRCRMRRGWSPEKALGVKP